ncbi:unnamed protein product [Spodoptera exigua]|nr:unnamed protein product [Spodoptera exigua]
MLPPPATVASNVLTVYQTTLDLSVLCQPGVVPVYPGFAGTNAVKYRDLGPEQQKKRWFLVSKSLPGRGDPEVKEHASHVLREKSQKPLESSSYIVIEIVSAVSEMERKKDKQTKLS